ncbi:hypothetical protein NKH18_36355 [Streptomyces sp. M10(2022)]
MDLPSAPTAFDDSVRPRAGRGADVGLLWGCCSSKCSPCWWSAASGW